MSAYSAAVLADSPYVYFQMPRVGTAIIYGQGAQAAALSASSATQLAAYTGIASDAGSIVAATQYQSFVHGLVNKPFSLECWVWVTHRGSSVFPTGDFLTANPEGATNDLWGFSYDGSGTISTVQRSGGSVVSVSGTAMSWNHIVTIADGSFQYLYHNGALVGSVADISLINTSFTQIVTSISGTSPDIFVAEVAFYNSALSSGSIAAHYAAVTSVSPPQPYNGTLLPCG